MSAPHAPLSYAQKEEICRKITDLPPDHLPGLLEIIQAAQPPNTGDDGEVEIDIEKLDDGTLLKVQGTAIIDVYYRHALTHSSRRVH